LPSTILPYLRLTLKASSLQLNKPGKPFIQGWFPVQQQTIASSFDKLQERI
jgi:hypothetical protein